MRWICIHTKTPCRGGSTHQICWWRWLWALSTESWSLDALPPVVTSPVSPPGGGWSPHGGTTGQTPCTSSALECPHTERPLHDDAGRIPSLLHGLWELEGGAVVLHPRIALRVPWVWMKKRRGRRDWIVENRWRGGGLNREKGREGEWHRLRFGFATFKRAALIDMPL